MTVNPPVLLRTTLCNARCLRYAAFYIARFLARCVSSDLPVLRRGLTPSPFACPQAFSRLTPPLAHREPHERRGEAVRCAAAFCIARFLARCLRSDLSRLHSGYFFA